MSIISQKEKAFGNIAALRTLTDDFPKLNKNNSFPSINNQGSSQDFLIDMLKALIGYEKIKEVLVDILVYKMAEMEIVIKNGLKDELKGLVNCGNNPTIPTWIQSGSVPGINIPVKDIDFFSIMKINPTSQVGGLMYDDNTNGLSSTDFNTFLNATIQDGTQQSWQQIMDVKFNQTLIGYPNNTLTITANSSYNQKSLTDLNNDFIDSVTLFATENMIVNIIDSIFSPISFKLNKTESQLEKEALIDKAIECVIKADGNDVIDNSFFEFSQSQILEAQEYAADRRKGILKLKTCGDVEVSMPIGFLTELQSNLAQLQPTDLAGKKTVVENSINAMTNFAAESASGGDTDKHTIELAIIELMFLRIIQASMNAIISPKIIAIFLVNYKIVYGQSATYDGGLEFLKKNKSLVKGIVNAIRDEIIKILLQIVLKQITLLIAKNVVPQQIEKSNTQIAQLLSLTGVPQDIIRMIRENVKI